MLKQTPLEWTAVRPVGLTNSKTKKEVQVSFGNNPKPKLLISRYNLAGFVVEILNKGKYVRELPVVYE